MRKRKPLVLGLLAALVLPGVASADFGFYRITGIANAEPNNDVAGVSVSANGKTVVVAASATNLVTGSNTAQNIYAIDLTGGEEIISRTAGGVVGNGNSFTPAVSADGRYVAFFTQAGNLAPPGNSASQILRKDRQTGALIIASTKANGTPVSGSASGQTRDPSISADGRIVVFRSDDGTIVPGDVTDTDNVFAKDLVTGAIEAIDVTMGTNTPVTTSLTLTPASITGDGRYVLFNTNSANIVAGVSGGTHQIYLRDRVTQTSELISRTAAGVAGSSGSDLAAISPNGRFVSFRTFAPNLGASGSTVVVRDRVANTTNALSFPAGSFGCRESRVSDFGAVVMTCFSGSSPDQVYLTAAGQTPVRLSNDVNNSANGGNLASGATLAISASGLTMAFESRATNLAPVDTNGTNDTFLWIDDSVIDGYFADGFE